MNRDLLKEIWSVTKEEGGDVGFVSIYNRGIKGFSKKEISDHVKFLYDEGYIEAINHPTFEGDQWHPEKILKDLDD